MCGIAGAVSGLGGDLEPRVKAMTDALWHRGPDDWGVWADELCCLGHRRLAIIDLSSAGRQPMANADGTIWVTFNGEIYNFQSLRAELEGLGHHFRTCTDSEILVHAYEQWGSECVKRLRGMFAFALWDPRQRRLFLARDRVGKKPLFYTQIGGCFLFASEIQGLLAAGNIPREVHFPALDAYLSWGYIPAPQTAFRGVFKLPPAHSLTLELTAAGPVRRVERYWSLAYVPKLHICREEAEVALREQLTEAVRLRMMSDVPIGAFLSGGIDSSIVVGLMAQLSDRPVQTFSIGFEDVAYDELDHARRVAERWSTDHHELVVQPDALAILPQLVRHYGEPYADASAIPMFYVSQMTRDSVTVALSGDGGDESFAGYERYLGNRIAAWIQRIPGGEWSTRVLNQLLPDAFDSKHRLRTIKRFLSAATQPMATRYGGWIGYFGDEVKQQLYSEDLCTLFDGESSSDWMATLFADTRHLDPVEAAMAVDVQSYLPYDLLVKVDIASMANSLEARSPFLDHKVMEWAARLPRQMKLHGTDMKYLLKRAFADILPQENVRRRKMGFGVPVGAWFRGPLRPLLDDALLSKRAIERGYFQPAAVRRLMTEHLERRMDHSFALWNLLMLELWHREFIDKS